MTNSDLPAYAIQDALEAAQHLCRRNPDDNLLSPAALLSYTGAQGDALTEVLERVAPRMGAPTLYGGDSCGPNIRWQIDTRCLLLDSNEGSFRLTSHNASALDQRERAVFERGVGDAEGQVHTYADLPVLWQLARIGGTHQLMPRCVAADWEQLEDSLRTLMLAWATQLPAQIGEGSVAFDIINRIDDNRPQTLLWGPDDGLTVMVDDEDAPIDDVEHAQAMEARGWHTRAVPVARWWVSSFEPDASGAVAAARLAVAELQVRGARRPSDLGVANVVCTDASGKEFGHLTLPGLGLQD
ncbi:hypothetical protein OG596_09130 [Streptomyces sp. NBC_01102]|uniref:hypothetical protein n=1 Tax=Streptomyces sp. NBC_01102 TaxID=2903749 RepID=UPI003868835D|nr:hypothetical protein OG596_09130 [Streptomyces sp. NBC_01102]